MRVHKLRTTIWSACLALIFITAGFVAEPIVHDIRSAPSAVALQHRQQLQDIKYLSLFLESAVPPGVAKEYARYLVKHGDANNIPPHLLAGILMQESAGNPTAVSSAGAIGLMQIIPYWWEGKFPECGDDLFDPETSICYGAKVFRHFLDQVELYYPDASREEAVSKALALYSGGAIRYVSKVFRWTGTACTTGILHGE